MNINNIVRLTGTQCTNMTTNEIPSATEFFSSMTNLGRSALHRSDVGIHHQILASLDWSLQTTSKASASSVTYVQFVNWIQEIPVKLNQLKHLNDIILSELEKWCRCFLNGIIHLQLTLSMSQKIIRNKSPKILSNQDFNVKNRSNGNRATSFILARSHTTITVSDLTSWVVPIFVYRLRTTDYFFPTNLTTTISNLIVTIGMRQQCL